jgi:predicted RNA methylase
MSKRQYATPFSILHAVSLLSHRSRISKFARAINQVVDSSSYVIDIGTGSGILAMIAARAGARKVSAIDVNKESIEYARNAAIYNGYIERIEFLELHYADYFPDECADVVICEMLSSMMLVEQQIHACSHAVKHLLKKGGIILPQQVSVYITPVECDALWNRYTIEGLEFPKIPQTTNPGECKDLADLVEIGNFDLSKVNLEKLSKQVSFKIAESGILHGLVGMFECKLHNDIFLNLEDGWKELFIPFVNPISVEQNEEITIGIEYIPGKYDTLQIVVEI